MNLAQERVTVLAVSPADEDFVSLSHIFSHSNWKMDRVRSLAEATAFLREQPSAVIISAADLPDGDWKGVLAQANLLPIPPRLIVMSHAADDQLWAEVLDRGGYDVLGKPFEPGEVIRVISLAWRQWRHDAEQRARRSADPPGQDPDVQNATSR